MVIYTMPTFAEKLRDLREAAGLTQKELAEKSGVSQKGISQLEQGVNNPTLKSTMALCRALGVSCTEFEGCDFGDPPTHRPRGRPKS